MTVDEILKELTNKLYVLPDQTGLSRCASFYMLYQGLETLKKQIEEERNKHELEIRALKERLRELGADEKEVQ